MRHWVLVWFVVACTPAPTEPGASTAPVATPAAAASPSATGVPPDPGASMANPASKHCVDNGGALEIQKEPAGEYGVCVFTDGSRCEEWSFFRGRCTPGKCRKPSGRCTP